jgi:isocitrate dehydrogenase kinase/phosphatase
VFPEEWLPFLSIPQELRELFLQHHGELLTAAWWRAMAARYGGASDPTPALVSCPR